MATLAKHYKFRLDTAVRQAAEGRAEGHPVWVRRRRDQVLLRRREGRVPLALVLRGPRPDDRAALPGDREPRAALGARGLHVRRALPGLRRAAPEAGGAGGARGRPRDRRGVLGDDLGRHRLLRGPEALPAREGDRRKDPQGDPGPPAFPRERRDRVPQPRARRGVAVGRRVAAHPARDADRLEADGRALRPRRALDRPAPARQPQADRHAHLDARPRQHRHRRRARRGDDPLGRLGASTSGPAPGCTAAGSSARGRRRSSSGFPSR